MAGAAVEVAMTEQSKSASRSLSTLRIGWVPGWLSCGLLAGAVAFAACALDDDFADELPAAAESDPPAVGGGTGDGGGTGFDPEENPCQGNGGELICDDNSALTCDGNGDVAMEDKCGDEVCVPGEGCVLCLDGQFSCYGNQARACNTTTNPIQWDVLDTCDPTQAMGCNPTNGTCEQLQPIGNGPENPTGSYYQYARRVKGAGAFKGGCDVDSYGDYLYVNHGEWYEDGTVLDVYQVELMDSDGDGELEPNQHPDNPDKPGAIEERVLTFITSHSVPSLGMVHHSEIFAQEDRIYFLNAPANPGTIYQFVFANQQTTPVVNAPGIEFAQLGFDDVNDTWYASTEAARMVFSFHGPTGEWVAEFAYPNMAGSHMDGMEVVADPNTGTPYVYVSDMTSDYLGQYKREPNGTWTQENLFEYVGDGDHVEGMGFGALGHFWITSGNELYEVGGGELQKYVPDGMPR
jgi:hypothetical protein